MRLRHFCGQVIDVQIVESDSLTLLQCAEGGDPFGPLVAGMMFWDFPSCIIEATDEERFRLEDGGFGTNVRQSK